MTHESFLKRLKFNSDGHIPAVIQDARNRKVLTLCYLSPEALQKTLDDGTVWVWRRSLGKLMQKGETSGHIQKVRKIALDCEGKSLLIEVDQTVAACHQGYFTCYFESTDREKGTTITETRVFNPEAVYSTSRGSDPSKNPRGV